MEHPNYYSVTTAEVRYDKRLSLGARHLYGEISALSNMKGYCWATNQYFADLYDVSTRTIQTWLKELDDAGHIEISLDEEPRQIHLVMGGMKKTSPPHEENFTPNR